MKLGKIPKIFQISQVLILAFLIVLCKQQKIINLNLNQNKYYDGTEYDVYDNDEFHEKIEGQNQYGVSMWFRSDQQDAGATHYLFHLTFLDNEQPWNVSEQTTSYQHLAVVLGCYIQTSNNIFCKASTFDNIDFTIINHTLINVGEWNFMYIGADQLTRVFSYFNMNIETQQFSSLGHNTYLSADAGNEQLDYRVKLYIGGSKDRPNAGCADCKGFIGVIYDPKFYVDFFTGDTANQLQNFILFQDRSSELFKLNLNVLETDTIYSNIGKNYYATFGNDANVVSESTDPTFSTTNGLTFDNDDKMYLNVNKQFESSHFISFWLMVTGGSGSNEYSVFEIQNEQGELMFALIYDYGNGELACRTLTNSLVGSQAITTSQWTHVFVTYTIYPFLNRVVFHLKVDGADTAKPTILNVDLPKDRNLQTYYVFGKGLTPNGGFIGRLQDIIGGDGSWFDDQQTYFNNCEISVGIEDPQCIYCDTGYFLEDYQCKSSCGDTFWEDSNTRTCKQCHKNCHQCSGPLESQCETSCSDDRPYLFDNNCFSVCPKGTISNYVNKSCECDPSCDSSSCTYNNTTDEVECSLCSGSDKPYIKGYQCVESTSCDFGTFADPQLNSCESNCVSGIYTLKNEVSKECQNYCKTGSVKLAPNQCLLQCPDTYYQSTIIPSQLDQSIYECTSCSGNCLNCVSAAECISCQPGFLIHEFTGACNGTCDSGFVQDGIICRICSESCTTCPPTYYLHQQVCLVECPIGYIPPSSGIECIQNPYPIVEIKTDPVISVGRRQDIYIDGYYFFIGDVTQEQWSIEPSDLSEQFFDKAFTTSTQLVIPYKNLKSNQTYTLKYEVTVANGNKADATITIFTSQEINQGDFTITPITGISGVTEFTLEYDNWSASAGTLNYDIYYGKQQVQQIRGNLITTFKDFMPILFQSSQQSQQLKLIFPPYELEKNVIVEMHVYTDDEEFIASQQIILQPFEVQDSLSYDFKSDVWWIKLQTGITLDEYVTRSNYLRYLYTENENEHIQRLFESDIYVQKQNLKFTESQCQDDVQCRGAGICTPNFYDSDYYQCECFWGLKGQHCNWEERAYQTMQTVTYQTLFNLQTFSYSESDTLKLTQILQNISQIEDGLNKKSFRLMKNTINYVLNNLMPSIEETQLYKSILDTISNMIHQSVTRPSLRPDEKRKYSSQFKEILGEVLKTIRENLLHMNVDFFVQNKYMSIYQIKQYGKYFFENEKNNGSHIIFPFQRSVVHIPKSIMQEDKVYTVQIIQYNFDPIIPQSNVITSQVSIDLFDQQNQQMEVTDLAAGNYVQIYLRKLSAYKPFRSDLTYYYKCNTSIKIDYDTYEWVTDRSQVNYVFENEHFIQCQSKHLSHFGVQRGMIEFLSDLPTDYELKLFGQPLLDLNMKDISSTSYDNDYNIELSQRVYKEYKFPDSNFSFNYDSPFLVFFAVLIFLWFATTGLNIMAFYKLTTQIYTEKHQQVLLLSYHPLISIFLRGQTFTSHTYQMRITKFFSIILSHLSYVAITYRRLQMVDLDFTASQTIVSSIFFGGLLSTGSNYIIELFYQVLYKTILKETRNQVVYSALFFCYMALIGVYGTYENGMLDSEEYGNYVAAGILCLVIDFIVFDTIIVIYAFIVFDSPLLEFLSYRGFFIRTIQDNLDQRRYQIQDDVSVKQDLQQIDNQLDIDGNEIDAIKARQANQNLAEQDNGDQKDDNTSKNIPSSLQDEKKDMESKEVSVLSSKKNKQQTQVIN